MATKTMVTLAIVCVLTIVVGTNASGADAPIPGTASETPPAGGPSAPAPFTAAPFADDFVLIAGSAAPDSPQFYFPSNGDGTFGLETEIPGLLRVDGVDVDDMDNDGDNDFIICDGVPAEVYLYTNEGGGSFVPTLVADGITENEYCTHLRIADFNEDGLLDFVVGDNRNVLGTKVYVQGSGTTFAIAATLDTSWAEIDDNTLFPLVAGDINGDGHTDILMQGYRLTGTGEMRFFQGDGMGGFAAPTILFNVVDDFGIESPSGLACLDIDEDGDVDIVTGGGLRSGELFVYTNDGTGDFTAPPGPAFSVTSQAGLDAWDADGDGDDDLTVSTWFPTETLFHVENLGGSFAEPVALQFLDFPAAGVGAPRRSLGPPKVPASSGWGLWFGALLIPATWLFLRRRTSPRFLGGSTPDGSR